MAKQKNRSGRPTKEDARDVKNDILNAAVDLFSQNGFQRVAIKDVTDKAGGSVGLVRHYFGTKDDLITATNDHVMRQLQALFKAMYENLDFENGEDLINRIQERTVNLLMPNVGLLFYFRRLIAELPDAATKTFSAYHQLLQGHFEKLDELGFLAPDANKKWLAFELMFIQLGPVLFSEQIEAITGKAAHDPQSVNERGKETIRLMKAAIKH